SSTGSLSFVIGAGGAGAGNFPGVTSFADVLDNNWHHIAGTWDGSTIRLYVDGVLQGTAALSTPANNTRALELGYSWGGGSTVRNFRGNLDEVSIYSRDLSAAEIQTIVRLGSAGKGTPGAYLPATVSRVIDNLSVTFSEELLATSANAPSS